MTTNEGRCEPPPELRDRDGWHWVQCTMGPHAAYNPEVFLWDVETGAWVVGDTLRTLRNYRHLAPVTPQQTVAALVEALEAADQFIRNGIELGFIRMPDAGTPDPALKTPAKIEAALALYRGEAGR